MVSFTVARRAGRNQGARRGSQWQHSATHAQKSERRLAPLDGIRAFAVLAVLLFHAGVSGVGGGLLGVDVFFVLSGFLITSLLCREYLATKTIGLRFFWGGRARRLLPALFILLLGVAAYAYAFRSSLNLSSIRGDALSTLLYVANWHFVLSGQSYFSRSLAPSPLLHMWSLSVEEQYYLVWPFVALFVLRRGGLRALSWVAAIGALLSALLMASLYLTGFSSDRLYYGSDTRAQALLVGSTLAAVLTARRWNAVVAPTTRTPRHRVVAAMLGAGASAWLLWACHAFDGEGAFLYCGGFLLVALGAGALVGLATTGRGSVLAKVCSLRPLTYIGRISYGLYLYHWPLFLTMDQARTGLSGVALLSARLGATLAVAAASFHFVEQPIRRGTLARRLRGLAIAVSGATLTAVVVFIATITPATAATSASARALTSTRHSLPSKSIPRGELQQLRSAKAFTSKPIRFLLIGDSLAMTTSRGLSDHSVSLFGVKVYDAGVLGCDLDPIPVRLWGVVWQGKPGVSCGSWRELFTLRVEQDRPQVAGILIGSFEVADHLYDGQWVHVGEPVWDNHLVSDLDDLVDLVSRHGTRVALFTLPYLDPPEVQPNGAPWPDDDPARVDIFNHLLHRVAAQYPKTVELVDLNRMLDPHGHYTQTIDGTVVRWSDGVHVSYAGGVFLQPKILPRIIDLGLQAKAVRAN